MLVSTRGRYAIRVMIDLAEHMNGLYTPMKEIADRQGVSIKYMTKIMHMLTEAGMLDGQHGKGGGYKLNKPADEYRIGDILYITEGTLAPVSCLEDKPCSCERAGDCRTLPMWQELDKIINNYLNGITLADLMKGDAADNYVI